MREADSVVSNIEAESASRIHTPATPVAETRRRRSPRASGAQARTPGELRPLREWWSARALQETAMTRFLERRVRARMCELGAEAAGFAPAVVVRVVSQVPQ